MKGQTYIIPEEYIDAITNNIMSDPVKIRRTDGSSAIVDRTTAKINDLLIVANLAELKEEIKTFNKEIKNKKIEIKLPGEKQPKPKQNSSGGSDYDYLLTFSIVGDSGTGKSCLLLRYADGTYTDSYISTIGVDFKIKTTTSHGKDIKVQIWDSAGQERFRTINDNWRHYRHGYIVTYDVTDKISFNNAKSLVAEFQTKNPNATIIIVGTKRDLTERKVVELDELKEFADQKQIACFETSAKNDIEVNEAFQNLIDTCVEKRLLNAQSQGQPAQDQGEYKKALINYLDKQLQRLPKNTIKYYNFKTNKENLEKGFWNLSNLQAKVKEIRAASRPHEEDGFVGMFFKANWLRKPQSFNELNEIFDEKNNLKVNGKK